ncbi:MAG: WYL domain-containing protein, partial [Thermodesulfobacteriota bacterium]
MDHAAQNELSEKPVMRGDQIARQWRILRQLEASRLGATTAELARSIDAPLRSTYRDLADLQLAGFPIYTEKTESGRRWMFTENFRFSVPTPFTFTELMMLHMSRDLFSVFGQTLFAEAILSLIEKVRSTLTPAALSYLEQVESAFRITSRPYKDYRRYRQIIEQISQAALERKRVQVLYHPLRKKRETVRKIDPYRIWFFEGTIYAVAFCHLRKEVRTFVVDRIKLLQPLEETFEMPENFDLDEYTRHSFKVMQNELQTVRVRISREWARYVGEKIWHPSQQARKLPDKSLELTFQV